jgi:hemolysin activation/secretion protein
MANDRFNISLSNSSQNGEPSNFINGINVQYMPLFMKAAISAGYIKDDSQPNQENHSYNANIKMPMGDSGFSALYGINGYDSRYSTPDYSKSYRGSSPSYGLEYQNGNFNAFMQKTQGQSPYFGINYFNRF